jgi:hypothetical protein
MTRLGRPPKGTHSRPLRLSSRPYEEVEWDSLEGLTLGEDQDWRIAGRLKTTVCVVARRRKELAIPDPPPPEQGKWPSDAELTRQNREAGIRGLEAAARRCGISSPSDWMTGALDREEEGA